MMTTLHQMHAERGRSPWLDNLTQGHLTSDADTTVTDAYWWMVIADIEEAVAHPAKFSRVRGYLEDPGEGRWTVNESTERIVATPVITASFYARFSSRAPDSYSARIVAALRNEFGGHKIFETIGHDEPPLGAATQAAGYAESVDTR